MKIFSWTYSLIFVVVTLLSTHVQASFENLADEEKKTAVENYARFQTLPDDKKEKIQKNWQTFQQSTPELKIKIEKRYKLFRGLSAAKRDKLIANTQNQVKIREARKVEKRVEGPLQKRIQNQRRQTEPARPPPDGTILPPATTPVLPRR